MNPIEILQDLRLEVWSPASETARLPTRLRAQAKPTPGYWQGLEEIQRFRDDNFLRDHGFSWPRDYLDYDHRCWHMTFRDRAGLLVATMRAAVYPLQGFAGIGDLQISRYIRALPAAEADRYVKSIGERLADAARADVPWLFEPGGWAIDPSWRKSKITALLPLAVWALGSLFGGGVGFAAATVPNGSSTVLKRLGASPLRFEEVELGPIHSDFHRCEMEILTFSSARLAPDLAHIVDLLMATIAESDIHTPVGGRDLADTSGLQAS